MRNIRLGIFIASVLLLSASCLVASAEEVKSKADEVQTNTMADMVWYQFYCTNPRCGYVGGKYQCERDFYERHFKNKQQECTTCKGLVKCKLVAPPR